MRSWISKKCFTTTNCTTSLLKMASTKIRRGIDQHYDFDIDMLCQQFENIQSALSQWYKDWQDNPETSSDFPTWICCALMVFNVSNRIQAVTHLRYGTWNRSLSTRVDMERDPPPVCSLFKKDDQYFRLFFADKIGKKVLPIAIPVGSRLSEALDIYLKAAKVELGALLFEHITNTKIKSFLNKQCHNLPKMFTTHMMRSLHLAWLCSTWHSDRGKLQVVSALFRHDIDTIEKHYIPWFKLKYKRNNSSIQVAPSIDTKLSHVIHTHLKANHQAQTHAVQIPYINTLQFRHADLSPTCSVEKHYGNMEMLQYDGNYFYFCYYCEKGLKDHIETMIDIPATPRVYTFWGWSTDDKHEWFTWHLPLANTLTNLNALDMKTFIEPPKFFVVKQTFSVMTGISNPVPLLKSESSMMTLWIEIKNDAKFKIHMLDIEVNCLCTLVDLYIETAESSGPPIRYDHNFVQGKVKHEELVQICVPLAIWDSIKREIDAAKLKHRTLMLNTTCLCKDGIVTFHVTSSTIKQGKKYTSKPLVKSSSSTHTDAESESGVADFEEDIYSDQDKEQEAIESSEEISADVEPLSPASPEPRDASFAISRPSSQPRDMGGALNSFGWLYEGQFIKYEAQPQLDTCLLDDFVMQTAPKGTMDDTKISIHHLTCEMQLDIEKSISTVAMHKIQRSSEIKVKCSEYFANNLDQHVHMKLVIASTNQWKCHPASACVPPALPSSLGVSSFCMEEVTLDDLFENMSRNLKGTIQVLCKLVKSHDELSWHLLQIPAIRTLFIGIDASSWCTAVCVIEPNDVNNKSNSKTSIKQIYVVAQPVVSKPEKTQSNLKFIELSPTMRMTDQVLDCVTSVLNNVSYNYFIGVEAPLKGSNIDPVTGQHRTAAKVKKEQSVLTTDIFEKLTHLKCGNSNIKKVIQVNHWLVKKILFTQDDYLKMYRQRKGSKLDYIKAIKTFNVYNKQRLKEVDQHPYTDIADSWGVAQYMHAVLLCGPLIGSEVDLQPKINNDSATIETDVRLTSHKSSEELPSLGPGDNILDLTMGDRTVVTPSVEEEITKVYKFCFRVVFNVKKNSESISPVVALCTSLYDFIIRNDKSEYIGDKCGMTKEDVEFINELHLHLTEGESHGSSPMLKDATSNDWIINFEVNKELTVYTKYPTILKYVNNLLNGQSQLTIRYFYILNYDTYAQYIVENKELKHLIQKQDKMFRKFRNKIN